MKRILFWIIGAIAFVVPNTSFAEEKELSSEQLGLRSSIMTFLKEEGYMPTIDSDGDIKFKSEGENFFVIISDTDDNPMYIRLLEPFNYSDDCTLEKVLLATKALNAYKGVKVICHDNTFDICAELFLRDAELFKESFTKLMSQIGNVKSDVVDECEKVGSSGSNSSISEIPLIVTGIEVANVDNDGNIIQDYGTTIYDYKTKYLKPKITFKPIKTSGTYTLYVKLYKNNVLESGSNSTDYSYSNDVKINGSSTQAYRLSGFGKDKAGNWSAATYRFEIWYGDYCLGSKTFKVY